MAKIRGHLLNLVNPMPLAPPKITPYFMVGIPTPNGRALGIWSGIYIYTYIYIWMIIDVCYQWGCGWVVWVVFPDFSSVSSVDFGMVWVVAFRQAARGAGYMRNVCISGSGLRAKLFIVGGFQLMIFCHQNAVMHIRCGNHRDFAMFDAALTSRSPHPFPQNWASSALIPIPIT